MATYNGHKNWNHWNVSLWINNDEGLYRLAMMAVNDCIDREHASGYVLDALKRRGITRAPDGAPYSKSAIRSAMVGM